MGHKHTVVVLKNLEPGDHHVAFKDPAGLGICSQQKEIVTKTALIKAIKSGVGLSQNISNIKKHDVSKVCNLPDMV